MRHSPAIFDLVFLALVVFAALPLGCATPQDPRVKEAERRVLAEELVREELKGEGFDLVMDEATRTGLNVMRPTLEQDMGRELSRTEDETLAQVFRTTLAEVYPKDMWVEALVPVYLKHLSAEYLEGILSFYRSPAGRRLLEAQATIQAEAEKAGARMTKLRLDEFKERFASNLESTSVGALSQSQDMASSAISIADAVETCRSVQDSQEVPIGCEFDYVDGKPAIFVVLPNLDTADEYWQSMSEAVGVPFCDAANSANRQAILFVSLADTGESRLYSCESDEWTDWFQASEF